MRRGPVPPRATPERVRAAVESAVATLENGAPQTSLSLRQANQWSQALRGAWRLFFLLVDLLGPGEVIEAYRARLNALEAHPVRLLNGGR